MTMADDRPGSVDATIHWAAFRTLWRDDDVRARRGRARGLATIVAVSLWVLALALVFLTWNGAAEHADVSLQLPYLVSGGLTALLLTLIGAAVLLWGVLAEAAEGTGTDVGTAGKAGGEERDLAPVQTIRR